MYHLTLCDTNGRMLACLPDAPVLPRFLHMTDDGMCVATDDSEQPVTMEHVTTFKRVASSVWVDDERDALFVRVMA